MMPPFAKNQRANSSTNASSHGRTIDRRSDGGIAIAGRSYGRDLDNPESQQDNVYDQDYRGDRSRDEAA